MLNIDESLSPEVIQFLQEICLSDDDYKKIQLNNSTEFYRICNLIVTKINKANYINTLSIVNKFKFDYDLFNLFLDGILYSYKYNSVKIPSTILNLILDNKNKLVTNNLNISYLVESFLTNLWLYYRS